jgi:hypothetical protein
MVVPGEHTQRGTNTMVVNSALQEPGPPGGGAPCIVFALAAGNGPADSVIPAVQNLMLAARSPSGRCR